MQVIRKTLFESDTLQIGAFEARSVRDQCGEVERQDRNTVVLPFSGVFSKHDGSGRYVLGTPSHAVFFATDAPYRIGYPGGIGDRALTLRFGDELAPDQIFAHGACGPLAAHGLLAANAMMLRNLLWQRLRSRAADDFEIESLGLDLLRMSLASMRADDAPLRRSALVRRMRVLVRVKEAIAVSPSEKWSIARLAQVANLSPFHLCHVFRQLTGTSVYDYVLHERLGQTLDAVLDGDDGLTSIALDAGFASHSHFTARFKRFFGCTPAELRRIATAPRVAELRKIMTARQNELALD